EALALGARRAVLLETDGREWGPIATAAAIVAEVRRYEVSGPGYDLLLCGNEAADTGDYQVGIRVGCALGWPCVTGIKNLEIAAGGTAAPAPREERRRRGELRVALPPRVCVKGGHHPAPLPVAAGRGGAQAGGDRAAGAAVAGGRVAQTSPPGAGDRAEAGHRARHRGGRRARARRRARGVGGPAMTVLCLAE